MHKILTVDDERDICAIISRFLTKKGFVVQSAYSGEDALAVLDKQKMDLIILDKKMPGMGGVAALHEIRKRGIDTPVIILTGSQGLSGDTTESLDCQSILIKPMDLDILLREVNRILGT
jgi:DNA-binding response OmpR family regulator